MEKMGEVVAVNGDYAEVVIKKESSCGENCASCGMCDMDKMRKALVYNECGANVGDCVEIFLESWKTVLLSVITFILPIMIFSFSFIFIKNELILAIIFVAGFILSAYIANTLAKRKNFMSKAIKNMKK